MIANLIVITYPEINLFVFCMLAESEGGYGSASSGSAKS